LENTDSLWIEHVLNSKIITSIYPDQAPSLAQVRLHELSVICGHDLKCRLDFDLRDFPADAPAKWVQRKCTTVKMTLSLIQATIDQCVLPGGNGVGDLSIVHEDTGFRVAFSTQPQGVVFQARATWIQIDSLSAYIDGDTD
jgi:hypothetical protein